MGKSSESIQRIINDGCFGVPTQVHVGPHSFQETTKTSVVEFKARITEETSERVVTLRFNPIMRRVVGSAVDNDLCLNDRSVSLMHAILLLHEEVLLVVDTHSAAGTFINGERLARGERRSIRDDDVIQFGEAQMMIGRTNKGGHNAPGAERKCA
jgi:hypothetical protein